MQFLIELPNELILQLAEDLHNGQLMPLEDDTAILNQVRREIQYLTRPILLSSIRGAK